MIAVLEKQKMDGRTNDPHIAFLACSLADVHFSPNLVPMMEQLYHVDFMASNNTTGNLAEGKPDVDWTLETDDYNFAATYCDTEKLDKYRQTMRGARGFYN